MPTCENCESSVDETLEYEGRNLCEDCYLDAASRIRACDPWGEHSKKTFREQHGLKGTDGLTDQQAEIYRLIESKGKATREEIQAALGISPMELENQFALLRHCQLIKGRREGDLVYIVLWE
ncbi:MAG: hypothetical protein JW986_06345 [Methanotrichaceae archaeon]|nr:hypothetical protein [Methanotrichaceae archaeon]